jgi:hypothetical protein
MDEAADRSLQVSTREFGRWSERVNRERLIKTIAATPVAQIVNLRLWSADCLRAVTEERVRSPRASKGPKVRLLTGSDLISFSLRLQTYFAPLRETKRGSKSRSRAKHRSSSATGQTPAENFLRP